MKAHIFSLVLLCCGALGQDVTLAQPTVFSAVPYLDLNAGRGGVEYSATPMITPVDPGGGVRFSTQWMFTSNANGINIPDPSADAAFLQWNNSRPNPYFVFPVYAFPSVSSGSIVQFGNDLQFTHPLAIGESAILTLSFVEINAFQHIVNEQRQIPLVVVNRAPSNVELGSSPQIGLPGTPFAFFPFALDFDNQPITFSYDYGDGSRGTESVHSYNSPGVYTIVVTASDGIAAVTASKQVTVLGNERSPVARFTTSDVVGYVGLPLIFDAITSTDPQNALSSYAWAFGDDSPQGSGREISKIYTQAGTYTVTLSVGDSEGVFNTVSREIDVLSADQLGTFDAEVSFNTRVNRGLANRDTLTFFARVNVGDTVVSNGAAVAVQIGSKRFAGTLDRRLRTSGNVKFLVKANLRKQAPGTVEIRLTARQADKLGDALAALGAGTTIEDIDLPLQIEVAGRTYSLNVPSTSEWSLQKGKVSGEF